MAPRRMLAMLIIVGLAAGACGGATTTPATSAGATPVVTAAASAAPTLTLAPTATQTEAGPTACDHAYYPLRAGATWTTNNGPGQTIPSTVLEVTGDGANAVASLQNTNPSGSTFTADISCGPDGLAYGDAIFVNVDGKEGTRTRTGGSGVFLPPATALVDGLKFSWTTVGAFDFPAYDNAGTYFGRVKYTVELTQDCSVKAPVTVTLQTGSATGFQVTCSGTRKTTQEDGKVFTVPNPINLYYLEGIGPSGVDPGTELVSYSIP